MKENLTPERDAGSIRLRRSIFSGTFLLVEGYTDKTFYERFVDKSKCESISYSDRNPSKFWAIAVLSILEKQNIQGILAIVDADFDHLESPSYISPNLLRTDTHDLETMLLNSPALDKVITEFGSEDKINKFSPDIRIAILESGKPIGYLRWISQIRGLNLKFEGITFSSFIDKITLKIDQLEFIREVKNNSQAHSLKNEDLQQQINTKKLNEHDPWQICCGHDLVEILSLGLCKAIGSAKASDVEPKSLERSLRLAYEETYFYNTQVYLYICSWETNNQPFKVLK